VTGILQPLFALDALVEAVMLGHDCVEPGFKLGNALCRSFVGDLAADLFRVNEKGVLLRTQLGSCHVKGSI
jgi:hypothetical protein